MPIYEYRRPNGTTFEVMQKMADDPLTHDPETGVPVERVFHPVAVHFKGKGFYNTDYGTRKRARENSEHKKSESSSDGSRSDSKSSDSKSSDSKSSDSKSSDSKSSGSKSSGSKSSSASKSPASTKSD